MTPIRGIVKGLAKELRTKGLPAISGRSATSIRIETNKATYMHNGNAAYESISVVIGGDTATIYLSNGSDIPIIFDLNDPTSIDKIVDKTKQLYDERRYD